MKLLLEKNYFFNDASILDLSDGKKNYRQWTVILGKNGVGKTSILKLIASLQTTEIASFRDSEFKHEVNLMQRFRQYSQVYRNLQKISNVTSVITTLGRIEEIPFQIIQGTTKVSSPINFSIMVYGYGANPFMSQNVLKESKSENSATLFDDDAKLINAEEWLLQLHLSASVESSVKEFAIKRRNLVKDILLDILPEDGVTNIRFTEPTIKNLKLTVEFKTPDGWVTIHQLSLGYKTMVAWMVDLAARMFDRYPESDNPLAEPAIVLVDEIDLHMHPKWQRKIFDYLSERFPRTQFIVTAHSPLIV